MNLKEFKIFCREYLSRERIAYRVFTINDDLKFSIASEIPPMDIASEYLKEIILMREMLLAMLMKKRLKVS
jgi:hypothetical protein